MPTTLATPLPMRALRRVEYEQLIAVNAFEGERLELLDGALVAMSPQGSRHVFSVHALYDALRDAMRDRATVRAQAPLALSDIDEPEPDVALVPLGGYREVLPGRALLVAEVSDTTRRRDLGPKATLYARSGVPEYWVIDLQERQVVVHTDPGSEGYISVRVVGADGAVSPAAFPDVVLPVATLLP